MSIFQVTGGPALIAHTRQPGGILGRRYQPLLLFARRTLLIQGDQRI